MACGSASTDNTILAVDAGGAALPAARLTDHVPRIVAKSALTGQNDLDKAVWASLRHIPYSTACLVKPSKFVACPHIRGVDSSNLSTATKSPCLEQFRRFKPCILLNRIVPQL